MAFPTTSTVLDDFNRANANPISGSWANMTGINSSRQQILSNRAQSVGSGSNPEAYNAATYGPDTEIWVTWVGQPTNNSERLELYVRIGNITNPNGYRLRVARNNSNWDWSLWIVTASSGTQLGSTVTGVSVPLGSKVGFEVVGTVLKGYLDTGGGSSQIISYDTAGDATKYSAAGYLGTNLNGLNNIIDDFGGGTVVAGGQSVTVGQVTTTSTAMAIGRAESKAIGQVTQSNTAQALTRLKVYSPTGQVTQTNQAQGVIFRKAKAVGQVSTNSTAQAIARLKTLLLGQVPQGNLAQTITVSTTSAKFIPVVQVVVTSTVLSIGWTKRKGIGQVIGTNTALATGRLKQRTLGLVAGTNTAQGITAFVGNKSIPVVQVGVDGEALGIYPVESLSTGQLTAPRPRYSIEREQYRTKIYRRARR